MKTPAELKQIVKDYCVSKGWHDNDSALEEFLTYATPIYQEPLSHHRWWNLVFKVAEVNGVLIGFTDAETTGDNSPNDAGWSLDWNSLCEVRPKEVVTTIYEKVTA